MQCFQIKQEIVQVFSMLNPHLKWGAGGSYPPPLKVLKMHYFDVAMPRNIIEKKNFQVIVESPLQLKQIFDHFKSRAAVESS